MKMIPLDSANHYVAGTVGALAGLAGGGLLGAIVGLIGAALARELYNVWRASWAWSSWSWSDIAWTLAGGAVVVAGAWIGPAGLMS